MYSDMLITDDARQAFLSHVARSDGSADMVAARKLASLTMQETRGKAATRDAIERAWTRMPAKHRGSLVSTGLAG